jgi:hypothetical protein
MKVLVLAKPKNTSPLFSGSTYILVLAKPEEGVLDPPPPGKGPPEKKIKSRLLAKTAFYVSARTTKNLRDNQFLRRLYAHSQGKASFFCVSCEVFFGKFIVFRKTI